MAIGMTFDQYWYGDVWISKAFLEADRLRQERMNERLWLQGMYHYDAITSAMSNGKQKYQQKPYDLFPKKDTQEEREAREEAERLQAKLYMNQMMRVGKNWGGK